MKGYIKGIISNESTTNDEKMIYPITVAEAVYFNDGKSLVEKINNNNTSTSTVIPNKWRYKNI